MSKKINSLETLRGFAALVVAFYHYPSASVLYIENGYLGVYFFFALSGFVITLNYFGKIKSFKNILNFQIKRFFRIYPVHLLVLFLVLSIQLLKFFTVKYYFLSVDKEAFTPEHWYSIKNFIHHVFLTQAILNDAYFLSWNGAAWTISVEFYTYFIFALLCVVSSNNRVLFSLIVLIFFFIYDDIKNITSAYLNELFLNCIRVFLYGSISYLVYEKIKFRLNDILFLVLFALLLFINNKFSLDLFVTFSILILLVSLLKNKSLINTFLNYKYFVFIGTISYSFYMVHQSVLYLYVQVLKFIFKVQFNLSDGVTTNTGSIITDTFITLSYIFFSIILSIYIYKKIENKFRMH